jgi:hypothetical protein
MSFIADAPNRFEERKSFDAGVFQRMGQIRALKSLWTE